MFQIDKGDILFTQSRFEEAIEHYQEAIRLNPTESAVLENRVGLTYEAMGNYPNAIKHLTKAVQIQGDAMDYTSRASAYLGLNEYGLAMNDAFVALEMDPIIGPNLHTDVEARRVLFISHYEQSDYGLALQHVEALLPLAKRNGYSAEYIADAEAVIEHLKELITINSN